MHVFINLFGFSIPTYGLMISLGIIISNIFAVFLLYREHMDINDFIVIEAYCLLGAFIGAKLLYIIISFKMIEWNKIFNFIYLNDLIRGGFVFYGGLIGGIVAVLIAGRIHKIKAFRYIREVVFLVPFAHSFGRFGCFMAGCCYGKEYSGFGAVVFPEGSYAPSGIELFPVQLVESVLLLIIAIIVFILRIKKKYYSSLEVYLIMYGIVRFILEYYRYDDIRGIIGALSTSQLISIVLVIGAVISLIYNNKKLSKKVL